MSDHLQGRVTVTSDHQLWMVKHLCLFQGVDGGLSATPIPPETDPCAPSPPSLKLGSNRPWVPTPLAPTDRPILPAGTGMPSVSWTTVSGESCISSGTWASQRTPLFSSHLTMEPPSFLRPDKAGAPADRVHLGPLSSWPTAGLLRHLASRLLRSEAFPHRGGRLLHLAFHSPIRVSHPCGDESLCPFFKKMLEAPGGPESFSSVRKAPDSRKPSRAGPAWGGPGRPCSCESWAERGLGIFRDGTRTTGREGAAGGGQYSDNLCTHPQLEKHKEWPSSATGQ